MQFNEPIDDNDGEPQVVDITDDFEDQDCQQQDESKQRSNGDQADDGMVQYFDNGAQFLSTEEQQRKLTTISYTVNEGKKGGSNIFNVRKNMFMSNITE